ncbi:fungal-specific transcription factor domain-containing protein [Lasiosphaeria hispida]|uniref:Fungal-specific transcription factor domain-containing protein n=1 Tax=Lasiosphaeria hispida TaxID=260671 RepID=A0AAJ0HAH8_9PEZI|nr:fungal-specific transcription factor domain-containing protein [Lasiosphaeria hispida]
MNRDLETGFALAEDKSRELLNLIDSDVFKFTRDNEQGPFTEQAQRMFLVGDREDQDHPLSRIMMQNYLLSYWENFSDQVPILHRPTFNPDTAPVILLVAMIAIGAATFNAKYSGSRAATAGMCLPNYLAWGVKWEMFRDRNFRAPASLWALQASILLETYEALYSTGDLHERAVIYHPSTIQLVRWGRSLVGTAGDSKLWTSPPASAPETGDAVDGWWHRWITTEATRRLAFASFVVDSIHSTIFGNSSIMTFHEVRIPLPCDDELWNATSGAEVRRSMARPMTAGAKRITFLEALKRTVAGQLVQTNDFGRTILLAGLLNVSFHGNRGDLQDRGIGNIEGTGVGGRWRPDMAKAIDSWKRNSEHTRLPGLESWQMAYEAGRCVDSNIAFLHQFAHMAIHTDFLECQIFAGAKQFMGKKVDAASRWEIESTMKSWAQSAKGRDAAFHALCLLRSVLVPEASGIKSHGFESRLTYSVKTDTLIYRPWVVYLSALAVWSYAFALEGPSLVPPPYSKQGRAEAVVDYLSRYGELASPVALATMKGLNYNTPILEVLREAFITTSWEFLRESSALVLGNCIKLNASGALSS